MAMNLNGSLCNRTELENECNRLGISAMGIARADEVDARGQELYARWIADGCHGTMEYLDRYHDVRNNPKALLPEAQSVIVTVFNYYPREKLPAEVPQFAYYAYGKDYHEVIKKRLGELTDFMSRRWGGNHRVCVDTAPLPEKYWAVRAGVGFKGKNSLLIVPEVGSFVFIGIILTTLQFDYDTPCDAHCMECGRCIAACPNHAIRENGTIDARKCLSYLTIEYRDEIPEGTVMANNVYGCDICQKVCPHNRNCRPTTIEEFMPSPEFLSLNADRLASMAAEQFSVIFRKSAVKRTKLTGILRNIRYLITHSEEKVMRR